MLHLVVKFSAELSPGILEVFKFTEDEEDVQEALGVGHHTHPLQNTSHS
jgi:hypothetical protein